MRHLLAIGLVVKLTAGPATGSEGSDYPPYRPLQRTALRFAASAARIELVEPETKSNVSLFREGQEPLPDNGRHEAYHSISREELEQVLDQKVSALLGTADAQLLFRIHLLEVQGREEFAETSKALLQIDVSRRKGPTLVTTRSVSRLRGHLGGQSPGVPERLLASIVDAFERAALCEPFIVATNRALGQDESDEHHAMPGPPAPDAPVSIAPTEHAWHVDEHEVSAAAHVASLTFEAGKAYALGLRYLYDHLQSHRGLAFWGYGAEARGFSQNGKTVDAGAALLVARGGIGVEQAFSVEAAVGMTRGERFGGLAVLGVYWSFYYVELGFSGQLPFAPSSRPDWLSGANFGVRINIPIHPTELTVRRHSPLPFSEAGVLPGFRPGEGKARGSSSRIENHR